MYLKNKAIHYEFLLILNCLLNLIWLVTYSWERPYPSSLRHIPFKRVVLLNGCLVCYKRRILSAHFVYMVFVLAGVGLWLVSGSTMSLLAIAMATTVILQNYMWEGWLYVPCVQHVVRGAYPLHTACVWRTCAPKPTGIGGFQTMSTTTEILI